MDCHFGQSDTKSLDIFGKSLLMRQTAKMPAMTFGIPKNAPFLQYFNFCRFVDKLKDLPFAIKINNASPAQHIKQAASLDSV